MNDKILRRLIAGKLESDPEMKNAAHIGVAVEGGIVIISGHVDNTIEKLAAEDAVKAVEGVRAGAEEIEIRDPSAAALSDEEIAQQAADMLARDKSVPANRVQVKVEQGRITMTGQVDWSFQKEAALQAVKKVRGVLQVTNLVIAPPLLSHVKVLIIRPG